MLYSDNSLFSSQYFSRCIYFLSLNCYLFLLSFSGNALGSFWLRGPRHDKRTAEKNITGTSQQLFIWNKKQLRRHFHDFHVENRYFSCNEIWWHDLFRPFELQKHETPRTLFFVIHLKLKVEFPIPVSANPEKYIFTFWNVCRLPNGIRVGSRMEELS